MSTSPNAETLLTLGRVLGAAEHHAVSSLDRKGRATLKQEVNLRAFVRTTLRAVYTTVAVQLAGDPAKAQTLIDEARAAHDAAEAAARAEPVAASSAEAPAPAA